MPSSVKTADRAAETGDFFPYATIALLAASAAATIAYHASGRSEVFVCYPREPLQIFGVPTLLSLFTHEGFPHLLTNSLFLLVAGIAVERRLGHARLAGFFFLCGLAGIAGQAWVGPTATIGASGAACGLIVAMSFARVGGDDRNEFLLAAAAVLWLAFDLWVLRGQIGEHAGNVGHGAHLGGAVMGLLLCGFPQLGLSSSIDRR